MNKLALSDNVYTSETNKMYVDPTISNKKYLAALRSTAKAKYQKDLQEYNLNEARVSNKELETSKEYRSGVAVHAAAGGLLGTLAGGTVGGLAKIVTLPFKSTKGMPLVSAGVTVGGTLGALGVGGYRAVKGRLPVQSYTKPDQRDYKVTSDEVDHREVFTKQAGVVERTIQDQVDNNEGWRKWFFSNNRQDDSGAMKHPLSSEALWLKKTALNMRLSKLKPLLKQMQDEGIAFSRVPSSVTKADYRYKLHVLTGLFGAPQKLTGLTDTEIRHFKSSKNVNRWLNDKATTAKTTIPLGAVTGASGGYVSTDDKDKKLRNTVVGAIGGSAVGASVLNSKVHRGFTNLFKQHSDVVASTLGHELGHHFQHKELIDKDLSGITTPAANYMKETGGLVGQLFAHRASKVPKERDASIRGAKLLRDLKIPVSEKRVNRDLSHALNTYKINERLPLGREDFFKTSEILKQAKQVLKGGKADNKSDKDFDPKSLKKGMKVEREHTSNKRMQKEIAQDHLTEDKMYYHKLQKMEKEGSVLAKARAAIGAIPTAAKAVKNTVAGIPGAVDTAVHSAFETTVNTAMSATKKFPKIQKAIVDHAHDPHLASNLANPIPFSTEAGLATKHLMAGAKKIKDSNPVQKTLAWAMKKVTK